MRREFTIACILVLAGVGAAATVWPAALWSLVVVLPLIALGVYDMLQVDHAIRRNFPLIGHGRYLAEMIRPEIAQYFIETDTSGRPFSREQRSIVYQRAKQELDTLPLGSKQDLYAEGYEWIDHSLDPLDLHDAWDFRVVVGGPACKKPYAASLLNISAMSYGSLSAPAVRALNAGARIGGFAHNTGEGGVSPYHLEPGGDLIWQIGTGYFGCRADDGGFSAEKFQEVMACEQIRMVEIKLSQGAKPGHGGILPAAKITAEISRIRGIPRDRDCLSPPKHSAFDGPEELLEFVARLRELSGGRPVGFKLCVGHKGEVLAVAQACRVTGITPDFITVDGAEGGTGAAPLEFSNRVGTPLLEGLAFVHDAFVGYDLRDRVKLIASGRIITGFDVVRAVALGADLCNSARGMMFALGCIQALRCNSNLCPAGIATHDPHLTVGLVVEDKAPRVANFHRETLQAAAEILGACGYDEPSDLKRWDIHRRISHSKSVTFAELFPYLEPGALLGEEPPEPYASLIKQLKRGLRYTPSPGAAPS